jgi:hypothetical protein
VRCVDRELMLWISPQLRWPPAAPMPDRTPSRTGSTLHTGSTLQYREYPYVLPTETTAFVHGCTHHDQPKACAAALNDPIPSHPPRVRACVRVPPNTDCERVERELRLRPLEHLR